MRRPGIAPSRSLVIALALAFVVGGVGTATAGPPVARITKATIKKVAGKVVEKKAPTLSVAKAKTADSATTAGHAASADTLSALPSGQTMSGTFGLAGGVGENALAGITYPRPLSVPAPIQVIDTVVSPSPACPGPGRAAAGVLCLYFLDHYGIDGAVGAVGDGYPFDVLGRSVGVVLTAHPTQDKSRVYGVWTVGAP